MPSLKKLSAKVASAAHAEAPSASGNEFAAAHEVALRRPTAYVNSTPDASIGMGDGPVFEVVKLSLVDENPYNARRIYRQERIEKLAVSIASEGQMVPGIAARRNGRYVLVAGHYRLRALKLAGEDDISLMVYPALSDKDLYKKSFEENDERDQQTALDNAIAWGDLLAQKIYANETDLSQSIGKSLPAINKTLTILKLPPAVLDIVKTNPGEFSQTVLYELTLLADVAPASLLSDLAQKVLDGEIAGSKQIAAIRAQIASPKSRKKKQTSRQHRITSDGQPVGSIKDFDDGRVKLEVKLDDPQRREQLVAMLKSHFGLT